MTRSLGVLTAMLVSFAPAFSNAAGGPLVRVVMPPSAPLLAGRRAGIEVQVLVPNFFLSAPLWPPLDVPGAVVSLPDEPALNFTQVIDGQTYAGIRRRYLVVPRQGGTLSLPTAWISFSYADVPGHRTDAVVPLPPMSFEAVVPAGADGPDGPLPVTPLAVTQSLDRDPIGLKAGDSLTRAVVVTAQDLPAMMIPPPTFGVPAGVAIDRHDPVLSDDGRNGQGRREDRVTYAFARAGSYVLPAVAVDWYNASAGKTQTARVPEVGIRVAVAAATVAIAPDAPTEQAAAWLDGKTWVAGVLCAMLLAVVCSLSLRLAPRARAWIDARRQAARRSERACFGRLRAACRVSDRMAAYQALGSWARTAGVTPLETWVRTFGRWDLLDEFDRLGRDLFSAKRTVALWDARPFATALVRARKAWLARSEEDGRSDLPGLNPWSVSTQGRSAASARLLRRGGLRDRHDDR